MNSSIEINTLNSYMSLKLIIVSKKPCWQRVAQKKHQIPKQENKYVYHLSPVYFYKSSSELLKESIYEKKIEYFSYLSLKFANIT